MRSRIALIAALAVVLAVVLVAVSAYVVERHDLLGSVDRSLSQTAARLEHRRAGHGLAAALQGVFLPSSSLSTGTVDQVVGGGGVVVARTRGALALPVTPAVRQVAAGRRGATLTGTTIGGTPVRLLATGFGHGLALEVAAPVVGIDAELNRLAVVLAVSAAAALVLALGLGAGVAGLALGPVRRLTRVAEEVAATQDLSRRIPLEGRDELSRLAASLNTVLGALQRSQEAQRQLVADASHELRTPLASLRTNVEILASGAELGAEARASLVEDVVRQLGRLGTLVGDLIELARQDRTAELGPATARVDLEGLVAEVCEDMRRHYPQVRIDQELAPANVHGVRQDLERLVGNLVDNAAKWSPEQGRVVVRLRAGPAVVLSVTDRGVGIDPAALPHVFDRFYRGNGAASVPGSGLGLAIVRRIVEAHGGSVTIDSTPGTGTRVEVRLPSGEAPERPGDTATAAGDLMRRAAPSPPHR